MMREADEFWFLDVTGHSRSTLGIIAWVIEGGTLRGGIEMLIALWRK